MVDFLLIELYIRKKYDQSVESYFGIGKMSVSGWRTSNNVPSKRLIEFHEREGTLKIQDLLEKIYPKV